MKKAPLLLLTFMGLSLLAGCNNASGYEQSKYIPIENSFTPYSVERVSEIESKKIKESVRKSILENLTELEISSEEYRSDYTYSGDYSKAQIKYEFYDGDYTKGKATETHQKIFNDVIVFDEMTFSMQQAKDNNILFSGESYSWNGEKGNEYDVGIGETMLSIITQNLISQFFPSNAVIGKTGSDRYVSIYTQDGKNIEKSLSVNSKNYDGIEQFAIQSVASIKKEGDTYKVEDYSYFSILKTNYDDDDNPTDYFIREKDESKLSLKYGERKQSKEREEFINNFPRTLVSTTSIDYDIYNNPTIDAEGKITAAGPSSNLNANLYVESMSDNGLVTTYEEKTFKLGTDKNVSLFSFDLSLNYTSMTFNEETSEWEITLINVSDLKFDEDNTTFAGDIPEGFGYVTVGEDKMLSVPSKLDARFVFSVDFTDFKEGESPKANLTISVE